MWLLPCWASSWSLSCCQCCRCLRHWEKFAHWNANPHWLVRLCHRDWLSASYDHYVALTSEQIQHESSLTLGLQIILIAEIRWDIMKTCFTRLPQYYLFTDNKFIIYSLVVRYCRGESGQCSWHWNWETVTVYVPILGSVESSCYASRWVHPLPLWQVWT